MLLLNRASFSAEVEIKWSEISSNITNPLVRDLWKHKDLGEFNESYKVSLSSHESQLLKIFLIDNSSDSDEGYVGKTDGLTLGIILGVLALLLGFIAFIVIFMNYKKKKVENRENIAFDEEIVNENLIRNTKDSDAA